MDFSSPKLVASLTTLAVVKAVPGAICSMCLTNENASTSYVQVFDAATTTGITLGTTTPIASFPIKSGVALQMDFSLSPMQFFNGIVMAATTTATGATTATTPVTGTLGLR